jgi:cobaltochelatase CobN
VHVKTNMMAILLVAAQKQFWQADEKTLQQLGQDWVDLLLEHGLPGSGHTQPDHPVFDWIKPHLRADQIEPLQQLLERARVDAKQAASPSTISELQPADQSAKEVGNADAKAVGGSRMGLMIILAFVALLLGAGYLRGRHVTFKGRSV